MELPSDVEMSERRKTWRWIRTIDPLESYATIKGGDGAHEAAVSIALGRKME
jgi:hypothetical protein